MIVFGSQDDLRVIRLPILRRRTAPETRTPAAHKRRHRYQHILCMAVLWMALAIFLRHSPDNRFRPFSNLARGAHRSIFGQPHVDIREVLKVLWKELRL